MPASPSRLHARKLLTPKYPNAISAIAGPNQEVQMRPRTHSPASAKAHHPVDPHAIQSKPAQPARRTPLSPQAKAPRKPAPPAPTPLPQTAFPPRRTRPGGRPCVLAAVLAPSLVLAGKTMPSLAHLPIPCSGTPALATSVQDGSGEVAASTASTQRLSRKPRLQTPAHAQIAPNPSSQCNLLHETSSTTCRRISRVPRENVPVTLCIVPEASPKRES